MKIVFVASLIWNRLCIIYVFFDNFFQKSFFTKNYFLIVAINLTTRGPLYTCLVDFDHLLQRANMELFSAIHFGSSIPMSMLLSH